MAKKKITGLEKIALVGKRGNFLTTVNEVLEGLDVSNGSDGKSTYDLYVQESVSSGEPILPLKEWLEHQKGSKGDTGAKGDVGSKGDKGDKRDKGEDMHISSWVDSHSKLPDVLTVLGQWWAVRDTKLLYHAHNTGWEEIESLAGVKGDKGDKGDTGAKGDDGDTGSSGVFDVDLLTDDQIESLAHRLSQEHNTKTWNYWVNRISSKMFTIPLGDMDIVFEFIPSGSSAHGFRVRKVVGATPSLFAIRRITNYDFASFEGNSQEFQSPVLITEKSKELDDFAYEAPRSYAVLHITDVAKSSWYTLEIYGDGSGKVFFDLTKRATQGRIEIKSA